ncbi:MAG: ShlB/FhaC/HecB family hemolysin secretion/activation protein, partial [Thermodesulfovibrio sp.]|nr:ShlB/FhaC/HecB family hemolysin secretion/activation protein [Thermodesulfovibrio sp.]
QEWTIRSQEQVMALRSTFSAGADALDATIQKGGPDGKFFSWTGQIQWIRRIGESGLQAFFRADAQLTSDQLLSMEKFSVGGMESVRGYRKNILVRDNGISSSLEIRLPLIRTEKRDDILQLIPFLDYGRSWNSGKESSGPQNIASAGAGIRWAVTEKIVFQLFWGAALNDVPVSHRDPQDRGFHFRLSARLI